MPWHLLLPLTASVLFAMAMIFAKRSTSLGATTLMVVFVANIWSALLFSTLWITESKPLPWELIWQPIAVGFLFVGGQQLTFLALERGDVSVATPILSSKVVAVAIFLVVVTGEPVSLVQWIAVVLSMTGIVLAQQSDEKQEHRRLLLSVSFALAAAAMFAMFDVLVQQWASNWGVGHFLPAVFWTAALLTLLYLPLIDHSRWQIRGIKRPLVLAALFMGLQAICIVCTLAYFGDAARVNVVYALRALWGVVLAWGLARRFEMDERHASRKTMLLRLTGALMLTAAVILVILA